MLLITISDISNSISDIISNSVTDIISMNLWYL